MIYLDYAATTPISDKAMEVYASVATQYFGNASSLHDIGSSAKQVKEASAKAIAQTLNAQAKDIHFTSGASEGNFLAIQALLDGSPKEKCHIITSLIEHSSVISVFEKLESQGYEVSWIGVDESGTIQIEELKKLVRKDTALISIQHLNSEVGSIQPIKEIGIFLKKQGVLFHTDAVQSYGKIPVNVIDLNVDALTISSHKIYGPKGIGAVWLNPDVEWKPYFYNIHQTKKLKNGTDNVPGMAGFATAAKDAQAQMEVEYKRIETLSEKLKEHLLALDYEGVIEGNMQEKSPYILGIRFPGMEGQFLMLECNQAGIAISTGSACQVGSDRPNRTMKAIGRSDEEAREFIRISLGKNVKEEHINEIIAKIDIILKRHFNKVRR